MPYELKPLSCDPAKLTGLSEKLIVSHWENNYGGAVKRLNAIEQRLAELTWASAPVFEINGLKREEMIASGSMILHEVYFDSLGGTGGDQFFTLQPVDHKYRRRSPIHILQPSFDGVETLHRAAVVVLPMADDEFLRQAGKFGRIA